MYRESIDSWRAGPALRRALRGQRATRRDRAVALTGFARQRRPDGQTLEGETLTLRAEAQKARAFQLIERGLQLGRGGTGPLAKRREVVPPAGAGSAKNRD
jgi:hypothetical protein